jgi:trk system potassium uptake protein TrkH
VNLLLVLELLGWLVVGIGVLECIPLLMAAWIGDPVLPWAVAAASGVVFGLPLALSSRGADRRLRVRDGFVVVTGGWVLASLFGGIPYVTTQTLGPIDAFFEAASGFTTTGSTVLAGLDARPHSLLFWRSLTQWVGGMGIIVFTIAVLPLLGIGGMQLFRAEVPGPIQDKLRPRIADTARRLWLIYVAITAAAFASLVISGMGPFDAICHAFTTLATGGYSTRDASIGAFGTGTQWVIVVFMMLAGTNFVLHYQVVSGRVGEALRDSELHFYLIAVGASAVVMAWLVRGTGEHVSWVRDATFQVVSLVTTTGFVTADYEGWPELAHLLVFPLLVIGGMAGSTSGGLKSLRVLLGLRSLRAYLARIIHPHVVNPVRYRGSSVDEEVVGGIAVFFVAYFAIAFLAATVVGAAGYDVVTSVSAAATALGNVGPGLGGVGPTDNFAHFPGYVKLSLSLCMIAGRLEIFTVLVLLSPRFWRR